MSDLSKKVYKKRVLFVGIPDMAYVCLDSLLDSGVNIVGVLGPKTSHPTYLNFKRFVNNREQNFIEYDELDDPYFIQKIRGLNADVAVVCSFNYKVPKILLNCVKDGFINVHPSLLPKYRGANPYSAVIANNERETGVSLHFMDENFDTGDLIDQKKLIINQKETMGTLFNRLNLLAINMLQETFEKYETSELPRIKQPEGNFVTTKGFKDELLLINYENTAEEIERFLRSLNPFLTASTSFRKNYVKIYSAEVVNKNIKEHPGTIVKVENDKFLIATKHGLLSPTALQFGSFFVGSARDFIKILSPKVGERFE